MKKTIITLVTAFAVAITIFGSIHMSVGAYNSQCAKSGCTRKRSTGSIYCYEHKPTTASSSSSSYSSKKSSSKKSYSSSKKKYDSYDVYDYKSAQDFADDKYEEFYDYEDDYDDEDEAYDAAEDYWNDHH
ncbi:hypothetical protein [Butyrivibrio sp. NC2002]|uniref:hypothetical protein n=1 Tax=Butyrivibrio sp. NC2002 TaxID=1410610 RepID=UPI000567809D|nr:hypothetical protein [Butyrivibrio sp. NC2002]